MTDIHGSAVVVPQLKKMLLIDSLGRVGLGGQSGSFGGGNAEAQFSSFLVEAYAEKLVDHMGWREHDFR